MEDIKSNKQNITICLENIRSLHNVGAIFRTCSFFGIKNIILLGYTAKPKNKQTKEDILNEELSKTSLGSEFDLSILRIKDIQELKEYAKKNNLHLISIEQNSNSLDINKDSHIKNDCIIIFGNETEGVSKEALDVSEEIWEIKKLGIHNSLNVATTVGIIINIITSTN